MIFKRVLKWGLYVILGLIGAIIILFGVLWATEWTPTDVETVYVSDSPTTNVLPDTLTVVSWNIGYAGLGDDMDFFYDGGKTTRTTQERTLENLDSITHLVAQWADSADFFLIQEVDFDSKRSYGVDQFERLSESLNGFTSVSALNYVSPYVPIPMSDPMGNIKSGLAIFSRYPIAKAERLAYPGGFSFPVRLFNLKRCMLSAQILTAAGDTLWINNTHNTAYDTGGMRDGEMVFMNNYLTDKALSITAGDWNSTPPGYAPSEKELSDANFSTISVDPTVFGEAMNFAADLSGTPTARFGYEPYKKGKTTTTVIDFALLGSNFEVVSAKILDLGFRSSDHNPVVFRIARRR